MGVSGARLWEEYRSDYLTSLPDTEMPKSESDEAWKNRALAAEEKLVRMREIKGGIIHVGLHPPFAEGNPDLMKKSQFTDLLSKEQRDAPLV
jgi:hypothetical protein